MITTISNNIITDLMRDEKDINKLKIRIVNAINAGADINANNDMGLTPLTYAETIKQTKLLIELGADVNAKSDVMEWTPLMLAKTTEQAKLLVNAGADINARNMCCENALMLAANENIAQFLIDSGSEVNNSTLLGYVLANSEPNKKIIDILLQNGADIKVLDMAFVQSTRAKQIKTLLELGVNVNAKNGDGKTALMHIFEQFSLIRTVLKPEKFKDIEETKYRMSDFSKLTKLLIDYGADVNIRDNNGNTALMYALCAKENIGKQNNAHISLVKSEYSRQIKLLIQAGVDVNVQNYQGQTALMYAENAEQTKLLLDAGADVNAKDDLGFTALMFAQTSEQMDLLLNAGADINARDYAIGYTTLIWTLLDKFTTADIKRQKIAVLLKAGANINEQNNKGYTALMYADNVEQTRLLLEFGADVNIKDNNGLTVLNHDQNNDQLELLAQAGLIG